MLRRLAVTAAASFAALSVAPAAGSAASAAERAPLPLPVSAPDADATTLTLTAEQTGSAGDGTYELTCGSDGSAGGTHPDAAAACERLGELAAEGADPFAATPADEVCTMQHGGPATAHITGTWQGRPVDAAYDRENGCEIGRWDRLVPVLPETSGQLAG